jgi:hypothetical protein
MQTHFLKARSFTDSLPELLHIIKWLAGRIAGKEVLLLWVSFSLHSRK